MSDGPELAKRSANSIAEAIEMVARFRTAYGLAAEPLADDIRVLIKAAVTEEREACAKIADEMATNLKLAGQVDPSHHINKAQLAAMELAHRIRARGTVSFPD